MSVVQMINEINQIVKLDKNESNLLENYFTKKQIDKGDFFIREGQYCNHLAFVTKGLFRLYYFDDLGNEISCYFAKENSFITSFNSFVSQTPTKENIQAIEDTEVLVISKEGLDKLYKDIPKMHIFGKTMAENLFIMMEKRVSALQSQSAKERYERMAKENKDILLKVPLQYTASYLGITPQHLSRLRKSLYS